MGIDDLAPLRWAAKPRSQQAIDLLKAGSQEGDKRLQEILAGHVRDGVCDDQGRLLLVWCVDQWVQPPWYVRANNERMAS